MKIFFIFYVFYFLCLIFYGRQLQLLPSLVCTVTMVAGVIVVYQEVSGKGTIYHSVTLHSLTHSALQ